MKTVTKRILRAVALGAVAAARTAGNRAAQRMVAATDAALVEMDHTAAQRQRTRAMKTALKVAGRAAVIAGTTAAAMMAVRAMRARRVAT